MVLKLRTENLNIGPSFPFWPLCCEGFDFTVILLVGEENLAYFSKASAWGTV